MSDPLSSITGAIVRTALDGLSLRQQLIAANISNANTSGYAPADVNFEETLNHLSTNSSASKDEDIEALAQLRRDLSEGMYVSESSKQEVELDMQLMQLNETVIRYQALIEGLGKFGSLTRMAISGEVK